MLFDSRDLSFLKLAGRYKWLPYDMLGKFGFDDLVCEVKKLAHNDYICISKNKKYIYPSPQGYSLLHNLGYAYDPGVKKPYTGSPTLRRRLEVDEIMLTCLRAGIDVCRDNIDSLQHQPVFFPAFAIHDATKFMSTANFSGFGHWGNKAYMLQYVGSESVGMYMGKETEYFERLASIFDKSLKTPSALILAGSSYEQVHKQIHDAAPSKRHGVKSFNDFWDVYRKTDLPVHLLSCDELGAKQLALMCRPDYNAKIARASFGADWVTHDNEIPEADGCYESDPVVIVADMNLRRLDRVCAAAKELGRTKVYAAAFIEQIPFLHKILPAGIPVTTLEIDTVINTDFKNLSLYSLDKYSAATGLKGVVIHV